MALDFSKENVKKIEAEIRDREKAFERGRIDGELKALREILYRLLKIENKPILLDETDL